MNRLDGQIVVAEMIQIIIIHDVNLTSGHHYLMVTFLNIDKKFSLMYSITKQEHYLMNTIAWWL